MAWCWPVTACSVDLRGDGRSVAPGGRRRSSSIVTAITTVLELMAAPPRASAPALIVGIDTGGTFTDVTLLDPADGPRVDRQDAVDAGRPFAGLRQRHRRGAEDRGPLGRLTSPACCTARPSPPT